MEKELRKYHIQNVDICELLCLQSDFSPPEGCDGPSLSNWATLPFSFEDFEGRWMHNHLALCRQRQESHTKCGLVREIEKKHRLVNNVRAYLLRDPNSFQARWEALAERRVEPSERPPRWACCPQSIDPSAGGPREHKNGPLAQQRPAPILSSIKVNQDQDKRTNDIDERSECSEPNESPMTCQHPTPSLPANEEEGSICIVLSPGPSDNLTIHRDSPPRLPPSIDHGRRTDNVSTEPSNQDATMRDFQPSHSSTYDTLTCIHCGHEEPTLRKLITHAQSCRKTPSSALARTISVLAKRCIICGHDCKKNSISRHEKSAHYRYTCGSIATAKGHEQCPEVKQCVRMNLFDPLSHLMSARQISPATDGVFDAAFRDLQSEEIDLLLRLSDEELCTGTREALARRIYSTRPYHNPDSSIATRDLSCIGGSDTYTIGESVGQLHVETDHRVWHANPPTEAAGAIDEPRESEKRAGLDDEQIFLQPSEGAGLTVVDVVPGPSSDHHHPTTNSTASHSTPFGTREHNIAQHSAYRVWDTGINMAIGGIGSPIVERGDPPIAPSDSMPDWSATGHKEGAISCSQYGSPGLPRNEGVSVSLSAADTISSAPSAAFATSARHMEDTQRYTTPLEVDGEKHPAPYPMPNGIHTDKHGDLACTSHPDGEARPAKRPRVVPLRDQPPRIHSSYPLNVGSPGPTYFPPPRYHGTEPPAQLLPLTSGQNDVMVQSTAAEASGHLQPPYLDGRRQPSSQSSGARGSDDPSQIGTTNHDHERGPRELVGSVQEDARNSMALAQQSPIVRRNPGPSRPSWQQVTLSDNPPSGQRICNPYPTSLRTAQGERLSNSQVISEHLRGEEQDGRHVRMFASYTITAMISAILGSSVYAAVEASSLRESEISQDQVLTRAVVTQAPSDDDGDWITRVTISSSHGREFAHQLDGVEGVQRLLPRPVSEAIQASQRQKRGETAIRIFFHGESEDCQLEVAMDNDMGTEVCCLLHEVPKR